MKALRFKLNMKLRMTGKKYRNEGRRQREKFFSFLVKILNMSSRANFTNRSARIKAEHKTLMKHAPFLHKRSFGSFFYIHVTRKKLPKWCLYEKFVGGMLMKLTAGVNFTKFYVRLFYTTVFFRSFSLVKVWLCNFLGREYRLKSCS